nr:universal stress protein [Legionella drancourtii]
MMLYKNIMLAIDGSDVSNYAVEEVIKLTQGEEVNVRLIYVIDESYIYNGGPIVDYPAFISSLKEDGQKILDNAQRMIESHSSIKVEKFLFELKPIQGRIAELIVAAATEWPADLLVIGTHGRRGVNRLFLGSVAENVIRIATTPVLLIRGSMLPK